jgi:hypothetical protein
MEKEVESLRLKLQMAHMEVVECKGRSGGLPLFWKKDVNVEMRWKGRYHIDVNARRNMGVSGGLLECMGSPNQGRRRRPGDFFVPLIRLQCIHNF